MDWIKDDRTPEQIEADRIRWDLIEKDNNERQKRERKVFLDACPKYEIDGGIGRSRYLLGRCANGAERDKGHLIHIVPEESAGALCGASYGRRSAGWSEVSMDPANCPRCLKKGAHISCD